MAGTTKWLKILSFSRMDAVALACAVMLSVACLLRGAVYDALIAIFLLLSTPLLFLALSVARPVHQPMKMAGILLLSVLVMVLALQWALPVADIWRQTATITGQQVTASAIYDYAGWTPGIARLLWMIMLFVLALGIGASESSARVFLQALLVSGVVCLALTFLRATGNGVPTSTHASYTHGFVNPNNAATYLGIMFLLTLAQAARFFRYPARTWWKNPLTLMDQIDTGMIIRGLFLLFAMLLTLAGLLMTGSRGGIFVALLCGILLLLATVLKAKLRPQVRTWVMAATMLAVGAAIVWMFINFGQVITNKFETDGMSDNARYDIFVAVVPMITDHPLLGTGLGSFPTAFQPYRPDTIPSDGIIDKAHNSYLEFAAEMGIPAVLALMAALGWAGWTLYAGICQRQERYVTPAFCFSVWLLVALHSLIDFPLQIPGILGLCTVILVVCISQTDPRFNEPTHTHVAPVRRVRVRKRRSQ